MTKIRMGAALLLIIGAFLGYAIYASSNISGSYFNRFPFQLGLDLNGGTHLTYKADVSKITGNDVNSAMQSLRDVIERRVNLFGVTEPTVQVETGGALGSEGADYRLAVELPGVTDVKQAVELSEQKYCSVGGTLAKAGPIHSTYRILKPGEPE